MDLHFEVVRAHDTASVGEERAMGQRKGIKRSPHKFSSQSIVDVVQSPCIDREGLSPNNASLVTQAPQEQTAQLTHLHTHDLTEVQIGVMDT